MDTIEQKALLTVEEAAQMLRLSRKTTYRRIETGELEAVHLGSGPKAPIRVPVDAIVAYMARGYTGETAA
jgi:excisionase family DNA binding protein